MANLLGMKGGSVIHTRGADKRQEDGLAQRTKAPDYIDYSERA